MAMCAHAQNFDGWSQIFDGWSGETGGLGHQAADEKRAHLGDEFARLSGFTHRLDDMRQRMKRRTDETDDEVVVMGIEAVASEADVMGEVLGTIGSTDRSMLAKDGSLLPRFELGECATAA